jgi:hypothetical protein
MRPGKATRTEIHSVIETNGIASIVWRLPAGYQETPALSGVGEVIKTVVPGQNKSLSSN